MSEPNGLDQLIELIGPLIEPLIKRQEETEEALHSQQKVMLELGQQFETLLGKRTQEPDPAPSPWNLHSGDPKFVAELLAEINQWIPWLNTTYGAGQNTQMIPSCWFLHPAATAHLMGLYLAWKAANHASTAPNSDLVYWNLRYLPDVLEIVNSPNDRGGMGGCRREHREPERVDPVPKPLTDHFAQWLTQTYPPTASPEADSQEQPASNPRSSAEVPREDNIPETP